MVKTTRSLECLLATALVCGCLVWRFAAPPVTPEWVELLRLRKDNDLLLQSSTVQSAVGSDELGSCASSRRAWQLRADRDAQGERTGPLAPSHCLKCSSQPPPKPPIPPPLTM